MQVVLVEPVEVQRLAGALVDVAEGDVVLLGTTGGVAELQTTLSPTIVESVTKISAPASFLNPKMPSRLVTGDSVPFDSHVRRGNFPG